MEIQAGKYYELGRKALLYYVAQKSMVSIFMAIIGVILVIVGVSITPTYSNVGSTLTMVALIVIAIAIFVEIVSAVAARAVYAVSKVMLDDVSLRIVHGVVRKEEIAIPFRRIQSVEIKRGLMHQIFGVGHVVISTTTDLEQPGEVESETDDEVVPVMDYDLSKAVADMLTSRAEVERMHVETVTK